MTLDNLAKLASDTRVFVQSKWRLPETEMPPLGAHLIVERSGYTHHGIYVGAGNVIHYSGLVGGWSQGPVELVSLMEFSRGRELSVRFYPNPHFNAAEIAARARSRLGENAYRVLSNNCEHFCEWCVLGASRSHQVELLRQGPKRLLLSALHATRRRVERWFFIDPSDGAYAV